MAFVDQAALAVDGTFRSRVAVAMATAAKDVMGEAVGDFSDTEYGKRQVLAYELIRPGGLDQWLPAFSWQVVANAAITDQSTDGDIQFTVNSAWNDLAGVRVTD